MERLTERDDDCPYGWDKKCRRCDEFFRSRCLQCSEHTRLYTRLADYEDAEEQGRLIEFPVAIGDHVWCFRFPSPGEPYYEMRVIGLSHEMGAKYVQVQDVATCESMYFNAKSLGSTMFLTEEEAKAKLKEMEDDNND